MYIFDSIIRYSETDNSERLSIPGIVNYFQDCSNFQSESLKVGFDELAAAGRGWVLSYWQIKIFDAPKMGTKVSVGTAAYKFERFLGSRNFIMRDEDGKVIAAANSVWVFMDLNTKRPAKAEGIFVEAYPLEKLFDGMEYEPRKIDEAAEFEGREPFKVRKTDLDTYNHVNNGQYIRMAQEYVPDDFRITQVRAEYKNSAVYGDVIYPFVGMTESGRVQVELRNESGKTFALVEWA